MMGGALGLAVLASLAALYTGTASANGAGEIAALNDGYRLAFGVGAACALVAAGLGAMLLPKSPRPAMPTGGTGERADQAA
jgi:hypothetical protein